RLAKVSSSAFLKLVIDGKRNLAEDGIRMIARGFKFGEEERRYFETVVKFNQTSDHEEKDRFFRELSQNKQFLKAKPITAAQYHLFSHWYYVVLLEMVRIETKEIKNVSWLCKHLNPSVPLKDVKRAINDLKQLDLIVEKKNGNLV